MKNLILIAVLSFLMLGCTSNDKYVLWETEAPSHFPKISAIGYAPLATQPSNIEAHKVLMAMQASKVAAYRELAEQVYGQKIDAVSNVSEWLLTNDSVKSSVSGIIRGAKVVKTYPSGDFYVTELELDFEQVWHLYEQQNRAKRIKEVTYF
ncbi:LPP20 family lipoprotein [Shewanella glacialimarina]|uniref:LPP20 family lipoprotein n=1 Tax=Shewanella glacialimarina TaxID=2590884 RepID=UPI001CF8E365|nr:LPP20 family lipoprotein [Shewanella glacialimarina]UCX05377.1 flagellar biosynthesis protein FlgP [Shewanella glacialimarina]